MGKKHTIDSQRGLYMLHLPYKTWGGDQLESVKEPRPCACERAEGGKCFTMNAVEYQTKDTVNLIPRQMNSPSKDIHHQSS